MQLTSFLPVALLSSLSFTSAVPTRRADNPALTWHVSNFSTGCDPAGCRYDFNILGFGTQNTPAFNATCIGTDTQGELKPCGGINVLSNLTPLGNQRYTVEVQHQWIKGQDAEYYAVGSTNVTTPIAKFNIPVTEEYGVA